jgi:hypothetical protein
VVSKGFVSTPKIINKKKIFYFSFLGAAILGGLIFWVFLLGKPFHESIEKTFRGQFEFSSVKLEKKEFKLKDFSWHVDMVVQLRKSDHNMALFRNMRVQARKNIFGFISVEKAILQVDTDNKFLKGGIEFSKDLWGWNFNLTNLEINLGSFRKKMGELSTLSFGDFTKENIKGSLRYNNLRFDVRFSKKTKGGFVFELPRQSIKVLKQKIPFQGFSEFEATGIWDFASRVEFREGLFEEVALLQGSRILVNMASIQSELIQSPRGLGVLDVNLHRGSDGLVGQVKIDLTKATFETNDHGYFKNEGLYSLVEADLKNNKILGKAHLGASNIYFDFDESGDLKAQFESLPLQLLPKNKSFSLAAQGNLNGSLEAKFLKGLWGSWTLDKWNVRAKNASLSWGNSHELLPGIKIEGETSYKGVLDLGFDSQKKSFLKLRGKWDLSRGQFQFFDYFYKERGSAFSLTAKLEKKNDQVLVFEGSAEGKKTFLKFSLLEDNFLELRFPQIFSSPRGSFTGSLGFRLCGVNRNPACTPSLRSYDLRLSDWAYNPPGQETELRVSGEVKQNTKGVFYKNLRAKLSDDSWFKIDADLNESQKIKDRVNLNAFLNLSTFRDSNLGNLFKIFKNKKTDFVLNVDLENKQKKWNFSSNAELIGKKIKLSDWKLTREKILLQGQGEVYLENYLLRNEPLTFTASAETRGDLRSFDALSREGMFDGKVFLASSGFSLSEWIERVEARFNGKVELENLPLTMLLDEIFTSYASETKSLFAEDLRNCVPEKIKGKVDLSYTKGNWDLSKSLFKGMDKDSMLKFEGSLYDLNKLGLQTHYLPGAKCSPVLSSCLGEFLPKGGIALDLVGSFKDPETDFDFKTMNDLLDKCAKKDEARKLASKPQLKMEDQAKRVRSLKNFYQSR